LADAKYVIAEGNGGRMPTDYCVANNGVVVELPAPG